MDRDAAHKDTCAPRDERERISRACNARQWLLKPLIDCIDPPTGPRGGVVTQRSAKPFTPVQFWSWPPMNSSTYDPAGLAKIRIGSCARRLSLQATETARPGET